MFAATRMAAVVAILTLGGSLALMAGPLAPESESPTLPGAEAPGADAAAWFSGSGRVGVADQGTSSTSDGVSHLRGQVSVMHAETVEVDDPRAAGANTFTQHAEDYGGFGPTWGTMRIETEDGAWVGEMAGTFRGANTTFSGWLIGEGVYEGLVQYRQYTLPASLSGIEFSGAILPAAVLPLDSDAVPSGPLGPGAVGEKEDV